MARIQIYVADDLKKRMDRVKGPNWSELACNAFERKLGELAEKKGKKAMADVIQRLRASKIEADSEPRGMGESWARDTASAEELDRLERFAASLAQGDWVTGDGDAFTLAERVFFSLEPINNGDQRAAKDFWEFLGEGEPNDLFVSAFVQGARNVWRQVRDKL